MLCDRCKKNEATIHIEKIHNGKRIRTNLCTECAKEQEAGGALAALGFNIAEVLFNKMQQAAGKQPVRQENTHRGPECPRCHWTFDKITKHNGRLGCPECYRTFDNVITDTLSKVQRGVFHAGKRPVDHERTMSTVAFERERLRLELEAHVSREEYEEAAVCRDRIAQLDRELESMKSDGAGAEE
ncbi:MAG: UvrB/UvrC motif-containing protein [Victivallaceae bacterium]|nr:UvrB/UvrC motif-containing protein [Victivallaceae bacterium]